MARTKITPRKSTAIKPRNFGSTDKFYSFKLRNDCHMKQFLKEYYQMWESVRKFGVSELDGVLQLVQALPTNWKPWAAIAALDFVHPDMEMRVMGNLAGFIDLIREQFRLYKSPPPGLYPSPDHFILSVHQTLSDILAPKNDNFEPELIGSSEIIADPDKPEHLEISFTDFGDRIESIMTSVDLDLYDQPFALKTPSPPTLIPDISLETSVLPSSSGKNNSEPETQPSVGTSTLQPLSVNEVTFNDPNTGVLGPSNTNNSYPQYEESDPETPEGYYDIDY